jgi:AcrR family transcriptional regulator
MAIPDPEQLRQNIVQASMPLLAEYEMPTTAQIAGAAGVSEADLLAIFPDARAVLQAAMTTMQEAMAAVIDPTDTVGALNAIDTDQSLEARLTQAIEIFDEYYRQIRINLAALQQKFSAPVAGGTDASGIESSNQEQFGGLGKMDEFRQAITRLLEPDGQRLCLPVEVLAAAFVGLAVDGMRPARSDRPPLLAEQIVRLFLHGALNGPMLR